MEIQAYSLADLDTFWDEYRRFTRPHIYKVDLSDKLYEIKKKMLLEAEAGK